MTPEKRQTRFTRWEGLGLDRVKADLANGGHALIGGTREVRELAHEWVRMKEAEASAPDKGKAETGEIFLLKPNYYGVGVDLKAAGRWTARMIKKWRGHD